MYQYGYYPQYPATPQPQAQQNGGIIWVQGEGGAKSYILPPGASAMLMDSEAQRFYIKSLDPAGMPKPLRVFEYHEVGMASNPSPEAFSSSPGQFVTPDELKAVEARIMNIITELKEEKK